MKKTQSKITWLSFINVLLVSFVLTGCVVIPYPALNNLDREGLEKFEAGVTTKLEVLETLGEPSVNLSDGRVLVFEPTYSHYGLFAAGGFAGPYGGGIGGVGAGDMPIEQYRMHVKFDERGILSNWQVLKITKDNNWKQGDDIPSPRLIDIQFRGDIFSSVHFSKDGTKVAATRTKHTKKSFLHTAVTPELTVWKINSVGNPSLLHTIEGIAGWFSISRDGKYIFGHRRKEKKLSVFHDIAKWDVSSGTVMDSIGLVKQSAFFDLGGYYNHLSVSPDGKLLSGKSFEDIAIWNLGTNERIAFLSDGRRRFYVCGIAFSPDSSCLAITGSLSEFVELWKFNTNTPSQGPVNDNYPDTYCSSVDFSPDGQYLAANCHSHIQIWHIDKGLSGQHCMVGELRDVILMPILMPIDQPSSHHHRSSIAYSSDGDSLIALRGVIVAWDLSTGNEIWRIRPAIDKDGYNIDIYDFALSPDNKTIVVTTKDGIYFYETGLH